MLSGTAQLLVNLTWTHTLGHTWQQTPFSEIADCAGYFGEFCNLGVPGFAGHVIAKNRVTTNINYASGPLSIHLTSRWIDGTANSAIIDAQFFNEPEPLLAIDSIGSKHYIDLGFGYEFTENINARFGINNLTDSDPPVIADQGPATNTDPGLFDIYGRSYYLSFSARLFQ